MPIRPINSNIFLYREFNRGYSVIVNISWIKIYQKYSASRKDSGGKEGATCKLVI